MAGCRQDPAYLMQPCKAERIVLCIDACDDRTRFSMQQPGKQHSTLSTIKKCAEVFLLNKAAMNSNHQFAILVFKAALFNLSAFHNKVPDHIKQIQNIAPNTSPDQPTQIGCIFQSIYDKILKNADEEEEENVGPLRIILFYGRSGSCVISENVLANQKNVTVDILYVHRPVLSAKEKKRITSNITELQGYLSQKSMCAVALCDSLLAFKYAMKLLMHPNLRQCTPCINNQG